MKRKKIWRDPSFWVLIGVNGYLVYHYYHHPEIFTTLIWLYWSQSVLMGIFNFLDMLTIRNGNPQTNTINGKPGTATVAVKGFSAVFFAFHYGFFHFVYFFFLASMKVSGPIQWDFFKYFFFAFLLGQIINFIQHKIQQRKQQTNLDAMFLTPYLRIIPMHLTILLPNFIPVSGMGIFLILKSLADVGMYIITKPSDTGREANAAILAAEQSMNANL